MIEKGKVACNDSVTVKEDELKEVLCKLVCNGFYNEEVVRDKVSCIKMFADKVVVFDKDGNMV